MTVARLLPRKALPALATTAVIAAAAVLWHHLPTPSDVYGPFDVRAAVGQEATGRAITATVNGVRIGPRAQKRSAPGKPVGAVGVWVAVDAAAMTTLNLEAPHAELLVGPNSYVPTERLGAGLLGAVLRPGITQRGSWVFDVPADLTAAGPRDATLRVWVGDGRLDSRLVIPIRLDDPRVHREDLIVLSPLVEFVP